jgi:hypothetical protein
MSALPPNSDPEFARPGLVEMGQSRHFALRKDTLPPLKLLNRADEVNGIMR